MKKPIFILLAAALFLCLLVFGVLIAVGGTSNHPSGFSYIVRVTGLESLPAGPITDVIVPMPILNGMQGFSDRELQYQLFGDWTSLIVVAGDTKMLGFQTTDRALTDINATFMGTSNQKIDLARTGFAPIPSEAGTMPRPLSGDSTKNTTARIYLDEEIGEHTAPDSTIIVTCEIYAGGAISYGSGEPIYRIRFSEAVPDTRRGWIEVEPLLEHYNIAEGRWKPYLRV